MKKYQLLCQGFKEPTNKLDKYEVAVKGKDGNVIGHLPFGKSGKFAKTVFYFLKSDKNHHCKRTAIVIERPQMLVTDLG